MTTSPGSSEGQGSALDRLRGSEHYDTALGMAAAFGGLFCAFCFVVGLADVLMWIAGVVG